MNPKLRRKFSCGVELTLAMIGGKWKPVVLAHLKEGALRYSELRARIPRMSGVSAPDRDAARACSAGTRGRCRRAR